MLLRSLCASVWFAAALFAAIPRQHTPAASDIASLRAAHVARPRDTSVTLELGLKLELAGDLASAEDVFLEAARWDRLYQPAWTLANFYFRGGQTDKFWHWANRAAEMAYDDYRPLLRLACAIESDPDAIVSRLGNRPKLLRALLDIMIGQQRMDAAQHVARKLAEFHDPADRPRFDALKKRLETAP